MKKRINKKIKAKTRQEELQNALLKIFDNFCRELLSKKIKQGLRRRKNKVLKNKKRTYNTRNIKK